MSRKKPELDITKPFYVATISDGDGGRILVTDESPQHQVMAWASESEALRYYSMAYVKAEHRSYESSMSACIHMVTFDPKIVLVSDFEMLKKYVVSGQLFSVRSVAGYAEGFRLQNVEEFMKGAVSPAKQWQMDRV